MGTNPDSGNPADYSGSGDWVGTADSDQLTNQSGGTVNGSILGTRNSSAGSSGGGNTITNLGAVTYNISGSHNLGDNSSGGDNYIYNSNYTGHNINGSDNRGDYSSGGDNYIINSGTINNNLYGSNNEGSHSSGGGNYMINTATGTVKYFEGSDNDGYYSSGGGNTLINEGYVAADLVGSDNDGAYSSGGENFIYNYGDVNGDIIGSDNDYYVSGGENIIVNTGTVGGNVYGSYNIGTGSSGGGNTIINTGTVDGGVYGSTGDSGGQGNTIVNGGTVVGDISSGDADDTVALGENASVGGAIDGGDGYDILGFYDMGAFDPASFLSNFTYQNFESYGFVSGSNTLAVDWDTGAYDLSVTGGYFYVAGGVTLTTNDLYVYSGGVLGGSGTVVGDVTNRGVISPGNSAGTLTIDGNFTNDGGTLLVELSRTSHDLLLVTGTATLNGGYVRASLHPDVYLGNESWTVLTATTVTGSFSGITSSLNSATLNLALSYSDSSVSVALSRKPYANFATTNNQSVVGAALDNIIPLAQSRGGYMADLIIAMDFGYSAAEITQALQSLAPDMYPAYAFAQLESAGLAADTVDARLNGARQQANQGQAVSPDTATVSPGVSVWAKAVGAQTSLDASQGWSGYDHTLAGLISGADYAINPNLRLGLAVGYTISDMSWDQSSYIGDMKTLHLLAYGGGEWNDFYAQASAGVAWHEADAQRDIDLASYSGTTQAEPNATSYLAGIKGGYDFHLNGWRLGPLAGLRYIHLEQDDFSEPGDLGLNINMNDADSLISTLGISASSRYDVGGTLLLPRLGLSWQHEFDDDPIGLTAWFTDYSDVPMVFYGQERPSERLVLDAGLSACLAERLNGSIDFSQTWGDGYLASALSLSLQYSF